MIDYSIIIPCYNESNNLEKLLEVFNGFMNKINAELVLVNNGSSDSTESMKVNFLKKYPFLKWVYVEKNIGYGDGIMQGINNAEGKYLAYTHADLQTNPMDVYKAILIIEKNQEQNILIKGVRSGRSFIARLFSKGMEYVVLLILGVKMKEINSQPTIFSKHLISKIMNPPDHWGFDVSLYYYAMKNNYKIHRIEVQFPKRQAGKSKWNRGFLSRINLSIKMIKYCLEIKRDENNKP